LDNVVSKHAYWSLPAFQKCENEILVKEFIKNQSSWNEQLGKASVFAYILVACLQLDLRVSFHKSSGNRT
jgi:hypothetical protein